MALKEFQHREIVYSTRILRRKRILVLNRMEKNSNRMEKNSDLSSSSFSTPPLKRRDRGVQSDGLNRLESLPQDLLVRILCKATHEDLKQLILVSKSVNEATLIAKELHFAYSTPRTKRVFRKDEDLGLDDHFDSREVPNAPRQRRVAKSRIGFEKLDSVTVDLFPLFDDQWPNKALAGEM